MSRILGYNVAFGVGGKTFVGVTANNFDIQPVIKESITKDDKGTKKKSQTGYDFTFSVDAVAEILAVGDVATKIGRDEAIALTIAGEPVDFTYTATGAKGYSGSVMITGYSEKTDSENEVTYSLNFGSNSKLTPIPAV